MFGDVDSTFTSVSISEFSHCDGTASFARLKIILKSPAQR